MEYVSKQVRVNKIILQQQMLKAVLCEQLAAGGGVMGPLSLHPYELHCPLSVGEIASGTNRQVENEEQY
jgi:hypothetical protein